jgi:hypothetical protein
VEAGPLPDAEKTYRLALELRNVRYGRRVLQMFLIQRLQHSLETPQGPMMARRSASVPLNHQMCNPRASARRSLWTT